MPPSPLPSSLVRDEEVLEGVMACRRVSGADTASGAQIDREMPLADLVVGAIREHLLDGTVERLREFRVLLTEADSDAGAEISRCLRRIGNELAAGALPALQESRQGQVVAEPELETVHQEVEI